MPSHDVPAKSDMDCGLEAIVLRVVLVRSGVRWM